jgi:hypothetical protein
MIKIQEMKAAIKNLPIKKSPGSDDFMAEFCETFKKLIPTILKLPKKRR